MKLKLTCFAFACFLLLQTQAATLYVDLNSPAPTPPYVNWATAALTIQDAVDAATNGDFVLVNDGLYQNGFRTSATGSGFPPPTTFETNRVVIGKRITVQSLNGPASTYISGSGIYRCVFLTNGATLNGFSLVNGQAGYSSVTTLFRGSATNTVTGNGGGIVGSYLGGGVASNCVFTGNVATGNGGAASGVTLLNCALSNNSATNGGGAFGCTLVRCIVTANHASPINPIQVTPFSTAAGYGGGLYNGSATDCLIANNSANQGGGAAGSLNLINCTIVNNAATNCGGVSLNASSAFVSYRTTGCIIYSNSAPTSANYNSGTTNIDHSCTLPLPSGLGNLTNNPTFVNYANNDFDLATNSPLINSGNNVVVTDTTDFDSNPRIVGGTVDIGAYEFQSPSSLLSYAWAQQFNIPTDGSADFADSDGDSMNNWQEFIAGTNPTNSTSVLKMTSAIPNNYFNWCVVKWQSVSTRSYFLERSTDISSPTAFSLVASNLAGQSDTTIYYDASATNSGSYFYRVGVQ